MQQIHIPNMGKLSKHFMQFLKFCRRLKPRLNHHRRHNRPVQRRFSSVEFFMKLFAIFPTKNCARRFEKSQSRKACENWCKQQRKKGKNMMRLINVDQHNVTTCFSSTIENLCTNRVNIMLSLLGFVVEKGEVRGA